MPAVTLAFCTARDAAFFKLPWRSSCSPHALCSARLLNPFRLASRISTKRLYHRPHSRTVAISAYNTALRNPFRSTRASLALNPPRSASRDLRSSARRKDCPSARRDHPTRGQCTVSPAYHAVARLAPLRPRAARPSSRLFRCCADFRLEISCWLAVSRPASRAWSKQARRAEQDQDQLPNPHHIFHLRIHANICLRLSSFIPLLETRRYRRQVHGKRYVVLARATDTASSFA